MPFRTLAVSAVVTAALMLGSCSSGRSAATPHDGSSPATSPKVAGTVTVLAAASLTDPFTTLGKQFEAAHPGVKVTLSFGASSTLAQQINEGAPVDVFAAAAPTNMKQVIDAGGAASSSNFAKNVLEIAVPPSNPAQVKGVADLARPGVKVALCQPQVPCGALAAQVIANAKVDVTPVTLEQDVKGTLTKVELNEVDAGLVYATDVTAAGPKVVGVPLPPDVNASTQYPIAALTKAPNQAGGKAFLAYVLSPDGQKVLTAAGFEKP